MRNDDLRASNSTSFDSLSGVIVNFTEESDNSKDFTTEPAEQIGNAKTKRRRTRGLTSGGYSCKTDSTRNSR